MKRIVTFILWGTLISCSIVSTNTTSHAREDIDVDLNLDSIEEDSTFVMWTAIIDSIKEISMMNVIECMESKDKIPVIERSRELNGEKEIRALYPHHQVGDTLYFIQYVICQKSTPSLFFWKKGNLGYSYTYSKKYHNGTDTIVMYRFDELGDDQRELLKICEKWDKNYLSNYNESHNHLFQKFFFRIIVEKNGQFQMDYISRIFQPQSQL